MSEQLLKRYCEWLGRRPYMTRALFWDRCAYLYPTTVVSFERDWNHHYEIPKPRLP